MIKWILRIVYAFLLIVVAVFVFREADADRRLTYLVGNANSHYEEGNLDEYIDEFMVATSRSYYISKPLYQATSTEDGAEFTLSIYHTRAVTKQGQVDVLTFVLSNIDITPEPVNPENYENDNNLIRVRLNLNFDQKNGHIYQDYNLSGHSMAITSTVSLGAHIPLEISIGENEGQSLFGLSEGTSPVLDSITIELIDFSSLENKGEVTHLASIENDDTNLEHYNVLDNLFIGEASFPDYNSDSNPDITKEALVSSKFNGNASRFNIGDIYDEDSDLVTVIETDLTLLDEYNNILINYFVISGIITLVVTYLLFFLKPTINYVRNRRYLKNVSDNDDEIEPIFKDYE